MRHGVLIEFPFQTALHGINFSTHWLSASVVVLVLSFSQIQQTSNFVALLQIQ